MSYWYQIKMEMRLIMVNTSFYFTHQDTLINFTVTLFIRCKLKWAISLKYQLHLFLPRVQNFDFQHILAFLIVFLIKINNKKLDQIISEEHFWTSLGCIYIIIDNNYKPLEIFQQADVYLNEPIKIDELIKLANQ